METLSYDIAVIGGGPSGMFAAGFAASKGKKVVLIEKKERLGKKILITGKGRCNITNAETDMRKFAGVFGKNGKFLLSAFRKFGPAETVNFFNERGVKTKTERGNRIFPVSDDAESVLNMLVRFLNESGVNILTNSSIKKFILKDGMIEGIILTDKIILSKKTIVCTGGFSYPATGSTGDGYEWAMEFGHTVMKPKPSLTPLITDEKWVGDLQGLELENVGVSVFQNGKKHDDRFGDVKFANDGLSGPTIIDMSKFIGELLMNGNVEIIIDLKPALDYNKLDLRILRDFDENKNRTYKNSLDGLLPKKIIPVIIELSGIDPDKKVNGITREERKKLLHALKEFKVTVTGLYGFDRAIITAGGICLDEIDGRTMKSKIIGNLYFAGEILDLDAPTGGYNLQECWSTGYVAGISASEELKN